MFSVSDIPPSLLFIIILIFLTYSRPTQFKNTKIRLSNFHSIYCRSNVFIRIYSSKFSFILLYFYLFISYTFQKNTKTWSQMIFILYIVEVTFPFSYNLASILFISILIYFTYSFPTLSKNLKRLNTNYFFVSIIICSSKSSFLPLFCSSLLIHFSTL